MSHENNCNIHDMHTFRHCMYDRCQWKFQYCNKHIIKNVSILKYVIGADGKIIKSSIVKNIFLLIALISERKEKYNTGRIFVKIH